MDVFHVFQLFPVKPKQKISDPYTVDRHLLPLNKLLKKPNPPCWLANTANWVTGVSLTLQNQKPKRIQ